MDPDFARATLLFKALADETRVRIIHILSCGELCACDIQSYFRLTQPTLSHHLAILTEAGLVTARRNGKWMYYSLSTESITFLTGFLAAVSIPSDTCSCKKIVNSCNEKKEVLKS